MFVCCEDFISVGLHTHEECCKDCHHDAFVHDKPRSFKPKVAARYLNSIKFYCCCALAGKGFSDDQMETVLQYVTSTRHRSDNG